MKPGLLFLLLFFFISELLGQDSFGVKGLVLDAVSLKPLPFAQIALLNTTIGTISNEEGRFQLRVEPSGPADSLAVQYLGYRTGKFAVAGLVGGEVRLMLEPLALELAEVEVVGLTAEEVLRRVVNSIPANYGDDSILLTAFIRIQKYVGNRLAEFVEVVVENMKTGYALCSEREEMRRHDNSNLPRLVRGRVQSDTLLLKRLGDAGSMAGCLSCAFSHDLAEFHHHSVLDENLRKDYRLKMTETTGPSGRRIYRITFDQTTADKKLYRGELIIDGVSFALLSATMKPSFQAFDAYEKTKYRRTWYLDGTPGWVAGMPQLERTITWTEYAGRYRLSSIRETQWVTFTQPQTGRQFRLGFKTDLVVTDATSDPASLRNFKGDRTTGTNLRWDQLIRSDDADFWEKFNYLPETE